MWEGLAQWMCRYHYRYWLDEGIEKVCDWINISASSNASISGTSSLSGTDRDCCRLDSPPPALLVNDEIPFGSRLYRSTISGGRR